MGDVFDFAERHLLCRAPRSCVWRVRRASLWLALKEERFFTPDEASTAASSLYALAALDSPFLLHHTSITVDGTLLTTLSEWMDGDLRLVLRAGPLPEYALRAVALLLLRGLSALHRLGRAHGDVSPSNVLLRRADGAVKLGDLAVGSVGTAWYSPREALGLSDALAVCGRSGDVWSASIVLREAAGGHPFAPDSVRTDGDVWRLLELLETARRDGKGPKPLHGVSRAFEAFLGEAMRWEPAERPDVERWLRHEWLQGMRVETAQAEVRKLMCRIDVNVHHGCEKGGGGGCAWLKSST